MNLFLPESAKDLICFYSDEVASNNPVDDMILINKSAVDWLNGQLDTGTFADILLQQEIKPESVIDDTEEFVKYLLRTGRL